MTNRFGKAQQLLTPDNIKKLILLIIPLVVIIFIISMVTRSVNSSSSFPSQPTSAIDKPSATTKVNKDFTFTLKDNTGKLVSSFTYTILSAELDRQIIIKGTPATAVDGRVFLIVNLKLVNSQNQGMQVNTRDYVRLSVNGSKSEFLAPEIHNDPVEVQALSTKYTRIGFPINTSDKKYVLKIGEIEGAKSDIPLVLK